jgi:hypothetical protein
MCDIHVSQALLSLSPTSWISSLLASTPLWSKCCWELYLMCNVMFMKLQWILHSMFTVVLWFNFLYLLISRIKMFWGLGFLGVGDKFLFLFALWTHNVTSLNFVTTSQRFHSVFGGHLTRQNFLGGAVLCKILGQRELWCKIHSQRVIICNHFCLPWLLHQVKHCCQCILPQDLRVALMAIHLDTSASP